VYLRQQLHNLLGDRIEIGVDGCQLAGRLVLIEVAVKGDLITDDAHLTIERIGFAGVNPANPDLRDNENVPLGEDIYEYLKREVLPHVPDAWIDTSKTDPLDGQVGIVGYEIPFNRHFYQYQPPRELAAIDADLDAVAKEIMQLLAEVHS
jgi:hypothetical protein